MPDVIIAGAGPTGLMLACELRLAGVDVVVLERLAERSGESRAGGLHARSVELFDQRGIVDRFLAAGRQGPFAHFSFIPLSIGDLPTRHPYALAVHQSRVERLLEERAAELGVRLRRPAEVTGLRQDGTGVEVEFAGDGTSRCVQSGSGRSDGISGALTAGGDRDGPALRLARRQRRQGRQRPQRRRRARRGRMLGR